MRGRVDKQEGKEEEEEPDKKGRRRWVGLAEEKVLQWGGAWRTSHTHLTFKPHTCPSKQGSTPHTARKRSRPGQ